MSKCVLLGTVEGIDKGSIEVAMGSKGGEKIIAKIIKPNRSEPHVIKFGLHVVRIAGISNKIRT
jgi:hypothetical protein